MFYAIHLSSQFSLELQAFFDVEWAGGLLINDLLLDIVFSLGSALVFWRNKKQTVVRTTTEKSSMSPCRHQF